MIAVEPKAELGEMFDAAGGEGKPRVGQIALSYDPDRETAVQRAHEQFRWFGLGWKVNADLPNPESFDAATAFVRPEDVGEQLGCGPDVEEHVEKIRPFIDAGFTEVALVQIGGEQQPFLRWAQDCLIAPFWFCSIDDPSTLAVRDRIGVDHIMVEVDYPHADSSWPDTQDLLASPVREPPGRRRGPHDAPERRRLFRHPLPDGLNEGDPHA